MFGSTCANMIRGCEYPNARQASTKSRSFMASVEPRATRTKPTISTPSSRRRSNSSPGSAGPLRRSPHDGRLPLRVTGLRMTDRHADISRMAGPAEAPALVAPTAKAGGRRVVGSGGVFRLVPRLRSCDRPMSSGDSKDRGSFAPMAPDARWSKLTNRRLAATQSRRHSELVCQAQGRKDRPQGANLLASGCSGTSTSGRRDRPIAAAARLDARHAVAVAVDQMFLKSGLRRSHSQARSRGLAERSKRYSSGKRILL